MLRCVLIGASLALSCAAVSAQVQRNFPQNALRGLMQFGVPPQVLLNGDPARLAPGVRIHGENNMLLMSGALAGNKAVVHYTVEDLGLVKEVWLLQPFEIDNKPWPSTRKEALSWQFDPIGQRWYKP